MTLAPDGLPTDDEGAFFEALRQLSGALSIDEIWNDLKHKTVCSSADVVLAFADLAMCAGATNAAIDHYNKWLAMFDGTGSFLPFLRSRAFAHQLIGPIVLSFTDMVHDDDPVRSLIGLGALFCSGHWAVLESLCDKREDLTGLDWRMATAIAFAKVGIYDYPGAIPFFIPALMKGFGAATAFNGLHHSISHAAEDSAFLAREYGSARKSAERSLMSSNYRPEKGANILDLSKVDLFIKTCARDEEYLKFCLASIDIFVRGFRQVIIVTDQDHDLKVDITYPHKIFKVFVPDAAPAFGMAAGYRMQMVVKLSWMDYSDADAVVITDSDTIFIRPFGPEDMLAGSKPVWYYGEWSVGVVWRSGSELAVGASMPYCCMREHPFIFTREATLGFAKYIYARFDCSIHDLFFCNKIIGMMCEFEILGGYLCHISNHGYEVVPHKPLGIVRQYWTWGGVTDEVKANISEYFRAAAPP